MKGKRLLTALPPCLVGFLLVAATTATPALATTINVKAYGAKGDGVHDDYPAIRAAMKATPAGGTLYVPGGVYYMRSSIDLRDRVNLAGAGIYRPTGRTGTWLKGTLRFGSYSRIHDLRLGDRGTLTNRGGAHDTVFRHVRFRGGSGGAVVFLGRYVRWGDPVSKGSVHHIAFRYCEWERPLGSDTTYGTFEAWGDWRRGGTSVHDISISHGHFGVDNGTTGYGCGRLGFLVQYSPNEYYFRNRGSAADWGVFLPDYPAHRLQHDISIANTVFEKSHWTTVDFTDFARAYGVTKWGENPVSPAHRSSIPARTRAPRMNLYNVTLKGVYGQGVPTVVYEIGRDSWAKIVRGWVAASHSLVAVDSAAINVSRFGLTVYGTGVGGYTPSPYDP
jgi:hypothetical protein